MSNPHLPNPGQFGAFGYIRSATTAGDSSMGEWMATVRFPDGTRKYARYSTNVESMVGPLYSAACRNGDTLPDGERCYRATVVGEPDPQWLSARPAPLDQLVLVEVEQDHYTWHALFCPRRAIVIGPLSSYHMGELQRRYELVRDDGGVRHLREPFVFDGGCEGLPNTACGRCAHGQPLPFYCPDSYFGT
jgi:hypothetical protein